METKEQELERIALNYHFNTENYDRMVCSCFDKEKDCAMPRDQHENSLVQKNAIDERRRAEASGEMAGFTRLQIGRAISEAAYYFDFQKELQKRDKAPTAFLPAKVF